jgi:hypothetical protein
MAEGKRKKIERQLTAVWLNGGCRIWADQQ